MGTKGYYTDNITGATTDFIPKGMVPRLWSLNTFNEDGRLSHAVYALIGISVLHFIFMIIGNALLFNQSKSHNGKETDAIKEGGSVSRTVEFDEYEQVCDDKYDASCVTFHSRVVRQDHTVIRMRRQCATDWRQEP